MRSPGLIARLSFRRGRAEAFDDAADLLDEIAGGLGDAIDQLGVEEIARNLRLAAGLVRSQADQLRIDSRAVRGSPAR